MKKFLKCELGQSVVEFALVFPILLLMFLPAMEYYRYIRTKMLLNTAASESLATLISGQGESDIRATMNRTFSDKLDVNNIRIDFINSGDIDEPYTYYVYSSDRSASGVAFSDQFEARPSRYVKNKISVQLSYTMRPITLFGEKFLGNTFTVRSKVFERDVYVKGN
ncbi:TadE/TadG family type IV pilus assembly protein [Johnsonella ignava]|jgi:hypothetical protein|uniref:TadE/TadG family type IV pilus assembly protein n=1 Tax=Johnsonella ignava TaxID=43995 RepID=UPI0023F0EEB3|nr:TadE/TadG family type IV pilus assembly protein [Johnsonella ignava]